MESDFRRWLRLVKGVLVEGKVERHSLGDGITATVIDPTRAQFLHFLKVYNDETARFNLNATQLVIGDHHYWTHHDLAKHTGISGIAGWLTPWSVVVWGSADIGDFNRGDQERGLIDANQADYETIIHHPVFKRLYSPLIKIGFTCNDGAMIVFLPDGTHAITDIDVRLEN